MKQGALKAVLPSTNIIEGASPRSVAYGNEAPETSSAVAVSSVFSPSKPVEARASRGTRGGHSNTPLSYYIKPVVNTCIDYLKVRFDGAFSLLTTSDDYGDIQTLFNLFKIDMRGFVAGKGRDGYLKGYFVSEGVYISYGGTSSNNSHGDSTWLLDISGSACRRFEERLGFDYYFEGSASVDYAVVKGWEKFLKQVQLMGGHCTRVDLPTDDFSGIVPFDGLRARCEARSYVSSMRAFSVVPRFCDNDVDPADFIISRHKGILGWTCTIGNRDSVQLCIYDKKAERMAVAGVIPNVPSWIRFELRYYHKTAEAVFDLLVRSFDSVNGVASFIMSCLKGVIRFVGIKNPVGIDTKNRTELPTWKPWEKFLSGYDSIKVISQARAESSIETNIRWLDHDTSKALGRVLATDPQHFKDYFYTFANDGISKLDKKDLDIINNKRILDHKKPFKDIEECIGYFMEVTYKNGFDLSGDIDKGVLDMINKTIYKLGHASYTDLPTIPNLLDEKGGK